MNADRFEALPVAIDAQGRWLSLPASQALLATGASSSQQDATALERGDLVPDRDFSGAVDVVFPLLHGPYGEDGTVQGLLELLDLPYVGAGVAASAVGMDKDLMKSVFAQHGLPVLPCAVIRRAAWELDRPHILERLATMPGLPAFVKPANMGSSVGVSRCDRATDLAEAIDEAFHYDLKVLVEQGVPGYREIECGVLGNDAPRASVAGEIVPLGTFYDYASKYTDGRAQLKIPADLRPETAASVRGMAVAAFEAIDAAGMARVDFLVSPDETAIWLSEINTIPGFTPLSMYPLLWQASGVSYPELIDQLVELALEKHAQKARLVRQRDYTHGA